MKCPYCKKRFKDKEKLYILRQAVYDKKYDTCSTSISELIYHPDCMVKDLCISPDAEKIKRLIKVIGGEL